MSPRQPIVIVSALEDPRIVHEAMTYGASGLYLEIGAQSRVGAGH